MTSGQTFEIVEVLGALPLEKVNEVRDFALFLKARYGVDRPIDESDEWSDEDFADISRTSFEYAYRSCGEED